MNQEEEATGYKIPNFMNKIQEKKTMEDAQQLSSHSSEPPVDNKSSSKEKSKRNPFSRHVGRRHRFSFLDSIFPLDFEASSGTDVESVDQSSPIATLEDCSTSSEESRGSSMESTESEESRGSTMESTESEESEPTSNASTSSDFENQRHSATTTYVPWRGFFGLRKRVEISYLKPSFIRGKDKKTRGDIVQLSPVNLDDEIFSFKSSWKNFSLSELQEATNNFSHENLIGEGGYAEVYKGKLKDGNFVAIKKLTRGSPEEMTVDFLSELGIIAHVDHPNIAKLIGYGIEGGMHLVLQLSPHGCLASLLYGSKEKLSWSIRFNIAVGTAEGLSYLHEGCQRRIIHKDIKPSNILLTEEFEAQLSDFGLSKWLPDQWNHHVVSNVEGTFGYLPPELFMHGIVNEKTDVYAFGVLLLELISGRQAINSSQKSLVMWAIPLIKENRIEELIDPMLADTYNIDQLNRVIDVASICLHQSAENRPLMSQVVHILKGDLSCLESLKQLEKCDSAEDLIDQDP